MIIYRQVRWEVVWFAVVRERSGIYEHFVCGGATDRTLPVIEPRTSNLQPDTFSRLLATMPSHEVR